MILALAGQFKQLSHEPEKFRWLNRWLDDGEWLYQRNFWKDHTRNHSTANNFILPNTAAWNTQTSHTVRFEITATPQIEILFTASPHKKKINTATPQIPMSPSISDMGQVFCCFSIFIYQTPEVINKTDHLCSVIGIIFFGRVRWLWRVNSNESFCTLFQNYQVVIHDSVSLKSELVNKKLSKHKAELTLHKVNVSLGTEDDMNSNRRSQLVFSI